MRDSVIQAAKDMLHHMPLLLNGSMHELIDCETLSSNDTRKLRLRGVLMICKF